MATPTGQIGLSDVNTELGFAATTLITMNDAAVRSLAGVGGSGTVISMQNLQGKSNRTAYTLTISADSTNYDIYANRGPQYVAGNTDLTVQINPGVTVYSTSTGSAAMVLPSAFNPADTITIVNNGTILGRGGNGGNGQGVSPFPSSIVAGSGGTSGGGALQILRPVTVTNNNRIAGGGGGGGGGSVTQYNDPDAATGYVGGGGGGGGIGNGSGGSGGLGNPPFMGPSRNGSGGGSGTLTSNGGGGGGGSSGVSYPGGSGGAGGSWGSSGSSGGGGNPSGPQGTAYPGGAAGYAVSGNPFITWPATGTRNGGIS